MAKGRILRKLFRVLIVGMALAASSVAVTLFVMARKDKEHGRFLSTGKSVNQFLASYKHGVEESFKNKNVAEVMKFYSERYASPGQGRWILKPDQEAGDVACFVLKADGQRDYAKTDLRAETEAYMNDLTSVDDVKFKIDMIEKI